MTTYPLTIPSNHITSAVLTMDFAVALTESKFSYKAQAYDWGGARWRLDISLPPLDRKVMEPWITFALALRGQLGTFLARDPSGGTPQGVGGGTPLVNGGGQTGGTLAIDGAPASTLGWLKAGDYFQLGTGNSSRLYKLLTDANTNGSGQVVLDFVPNLRTPPADNAPLVINNAMGTFRMASNSVPWTADASGKKLRFNFTAMEAL